MRKEADFVTDQQNDRKLGDAAGGASYKAKKGMRLSGHDSFWTETATEIWDI